MKCTTVINPQREEEVVIYAHETTKLVQTIEQLIAEAGVELIGYKNKEIYPLALEDVVCFTVEDNKLYARLQNEKLQLKCRLYQLEETLPETFIKINQSCIANIKQIRHFDAAFSGALLVIFKNGYRDYVSRRNLKKVKERFGF